jgi:hypothetical protein
MTSASSGVEKRKLTGLVAEIVRYLDVVETFRREGCAPRWRPEFLSQPPATAVRAPLAAQSRLAS